MGDYRKGGSSRPSKGGGVNILYFCPCPAPGVSISRLGGGHGPVAPSMPSMGCRCHRKALTWHMFYGQFCDSGTLEGFILNFEQNIMVTFLKYHQNIIFMNKRLCGAK